MSDTLITDPADVPTAESPSTPDAATGNSQETTEASGSSRTSRETLARLLTQMIHVLNARRHESKRETMEFVARELEYSTDAIYKWRKGAANPNTQTIAALVEIGVAQASMPRTWAEALLRYTHHPATPTILARLFPTARDGTRHNLPRRPISVLGRTDELRQLMTLLSPERREYAICIEGQGGVGKTTLALETAWRLVEQYATLDEGRRFDYIVWASAQHATLSASGEIPQLTACSDLQSIYETIADVLKRPEILATADSVGARPINLALHEAGRVLLIIDNFEAVSDPRPVLAFARSVPPPTKVLVTSRFHEDFPYSLRLAALHDEHMRLFLAQEAQAHGVTLDAQQLETLLKHVQGIPLAGSLAISLMAFKGYGVERVLNRLEARNGPVCRFLFRETMARLLAAQEQEDVPVYDVLHLLAYYEHGASAPVLHRAFGLDEVACEEALRSLGTWNLVQQSGDDGRYTMLPLTRTFARQGDLSQDAPSKEWEMQHRQRWIDDYLRLVEQHGGYERAHAGETPRAYAMLEEEWPNLRAVMDWCRDHNRLDVLKRFLLASAEGAPALLSPFGEDSGKWVDMLYYLEALESKAHTLSDLDAEVSAAVARAHILVLQYKLDAAQACLGHVQERVGHADVLTQCEAALVEAILHTRNDQPSLAGEALTRLKALVRLVSRADTRERYDVQRLYYEGVVAQQCGNYADAQRCFGELRRLAADLGWDRPLAHALLREGMMALEAATDAHALAAAHHLLEEGRALVHERDMYLHARYLEAFANYEQRTGNLAEMRTLANEACGIYEALGISEKYQRAKGLLSMAGS